MCYAFVVIGSRRTYFAHFFWERIILPLFVRAARLLVRSPSHFFNLFSVSLVMVTVVDGWRCFTLSPLQRPAMLTHGGGGELRRQRGRPRRIFAQPTAQLLGGTLQGDYASSHCPHLNPHTRAP